MSRLQSLYIPFVSGVHDEVAPEVLPDGALRDARNGRLLKAGSVGLRRGWRPLSMGALSPAGSVLGGGSAVLDLYSRGGALVALVDTGLVDGGPTLQTLVRPTASFPWVRADKRLPPATLVRQVGNVPDRPADVVRASAAVTSDGVWGATLAQTTDTTYLRVYDLASDRTQFVTTFSAASPAAPRKVVSLGSTFGIVRNTGTALQLQTFNPAASAPTPSSNTTLVTVAANHFDVVTAGETTPTALHLVYTDSAGEVSYAQFSLAGVQSGSTKQVLASGGGYAAVASDDVTAHVVYQTTADDELHLLSFAAVSGGPYTTSAGPTELNNGVAYNEQQFAVGYRTAGTDTVFVAAVRSVVNTDLLHVTASSHAITRQVALGSTVLVSGWVVRGSAAGCGVMRGPGPGRRDTLMLDADGPWVVGSYSLGAIPVASGGTPYPPFAPGVAPTGDAVVPLNRVSDATTSQSRAEGQIVTKQLDVRTFRVDDAARRPAVEHAGVLYVAGGVLSQYVAGDLSDNGMLQPVISAVAQSEDTGAIANGDYQYRAVAVWTDAAGLTHRSAVSAPFDRTMSGANDTATATVRVARTLRRSADADVVVELYRTEAGPGELFYHVASVAASDPDTDSVTVVDTLADAAIIDNKRLYTEGEFGAVSGALDIAPASSGAYVAVLRDRVVVGGPGPEYQISQTVLPSEPAAFTQPGVSGPSALVYQDTVEGDLAGLATLDDTVVLGTATRLYITAPVGPGPNLAGVGEFSSPARLPTDVGFYDHRSIVEDAAGLWFLGDQARLYLLPRGEGAPGYAGAAVEDRFAAGETVGAGREQADDLTAWAVADGEDSLLVARHTETGQWLVDDLPFTPRALATHDGELYAVDADGDVWAFGLGGVYGDGASGASAVVLQLESGDAQPFGLGGHGRMAVVELLGEYQSDATLLLELSYDMGASWVAVGTAFSVTGLTAGTRFQREWRPALQRGGKFRFRVTMTPTSTTTEGCRLTGLVLNYATKRGQTRLDAAKRR